jgi:hypothetical protein
MDKVEGEAYDKLRGIREDDWVMGYLTLYKWFAEVSGVGLTEQARRLMHPELPKKEEDLAEAVDNRVEKVRRLEAHGSKYALAAVFKVTALRCLMVGKAKEYFELWESEHEADEAGGFEDILNKVKDYARKKKLYSSVSNSKDDMDLRRVGEEWSEEDG